MRVITAVVGQVQTNFFENRSRAPELPEGSLYAAAGEDIEAMETGKLQARQEDPNAFAAFMVGKVLSGATGSVWKGGSAGAAKWASALVPTWILVDFAEHVQHILLAGTRTILSAQEQASRSSIDRFVRDILVFQDHILRAGTGFDTLHS